MGGDTHLLFLVFTSKRKRKKETIKSKQAQTV